MNVVQLGPYPPPHGGIQTHVTSLRDFLVGQRISCSVINITATKRQNSDQVYYPMGALQLAALLLRLRYDIVHIHIGGHLTRRLVGLGLFCSLVPGKKVVLTLHSGGYPSSADAATASPGTLRGLVLRRFDRVIGVNARIIDLFHRFGVSPARTRLISPYGVANPNSGQAEATVEDGDPQMVLEFYRLHDPVLLSVGLLEPEYDLPLQIDVLGSLLPEFPRLGLAIIGSGSLEPSIRSLVASKPYAGHILVAGDVSHRATLRAMSRSAILIRSTIYDGDSIAIREALDIGIPVIATDNGMRPAGVHLFGRGDPDALRRTIEERLSAGCRRVAGAIHTHDDNLKSILEVYQELSAGNSA